MFRNIKRSLHERFVPQCWLVLLDGLYFTSCTSLCPQPRWPNKEALLSFLTKSWSDLCASTFLISAFMVIYTRFFNKSENTWLSTYGRMSLTNYVTQGIVGSDRLYGYGLAMYHHWGATLSLCFGVLLSRFKSLCRGNGPRSTGKVLERLWRTLTMMAH